MGKRKLGDARDKKEETDKSKWQAIVAGILPILNTVLNFFKQGHIAFIKSGSKDINNVTEDFCFKATVFSIDNNMTCSKSTY